MQVTIVDYGTGNIHSVQKAIDTAAKDISKNIKIKVSNNSKEILNSDKLILPGQGSYKQCMDNIEKIPNLKNCLNEFVIVKKKPIFGICVGMQLFSDEGLEQEKTKGFGWIAGVVKKIILKDKNLKLPHMGWNQIKFKNNFLLTDIQNLSHFYFVHSYNFEVTDKQYIAATVEYEKILVAVVLKDNIFGTQFHPEKSQENGIKIFSNFLNWDL
jgi:glutamine amidotransferase